MKAFDTVGEMKSQIELDLESMSGKIGAAIRKDINENVARLIDPKFRTGVKVDVQPTATGGFQLTINIDDWIDKDKKKDIEDRIRGYLDSIGARHGACSGPVPKILETIISR